MAIVSVIVPVYNAERWLRRCVDSILAQTFTDFELLLIDDGSSDGSGAICDEYAAADPPRPHVPQAQRRRQLRPKYGFGESGGRVDKFCR